MRMLRTKQKFRLRHQIMRLLALLASDNQSGKRDTTSKVKERIPVAKVKKVRSPLHTSVIDVWTRIITLSDASVIN